MWKETKKGVEEFQRKYSGCQCLQYIECGTDKRQNVDKFVWCDSNIFATKTHYYVNNY